MIQIAGAIYDGNCTVTKFDRTGQDSGIEDVAVFMKIEGIALSFTALYAVTVRLYAYEKNTILIGI